MSTDQPGQGAGPTDSTYDKLWRLWHAVLDSLLLAVTGNQVCRASTLAVAVVFLRMNGVRAERGNKKSVGLGLTGLVKAMNEQEPFK